MSRTLNNFEQLYLEFYLKLLAACISTTTCRVFKEGGRRKDAAAQGEDGGEDAAAQREDGGEDAAAQREDGPAPRNEDRQMETGARNAEFERGLFDMKQKASEQLRG
jgi:hypothetical protein